MGKYPGWHTFAQPLAFSRLQHDGAGFLTFLRVLHGTKIVFWLEWTGGTPTPQGLKDIARALDHQDFVNVQYTEPAPWFPVDGDGAYKFDWKVCREKTEAHEMYRSARWRAHKAARGTTL